MLSAFGPSLNDPNTGSPAPLVRRCTSRKTTALSAAAISSLPSCVRTIPVGDDASGATRDSSTTPPLRFRTAMPGAPPVRETNTQQPSRDGTAVNGFDGSAIVTDGEAAFALQLADCACAATASIDAIVSICRMCLRMVRLSDENGWLTAPRRAT